MRWLNDPLIDGFEYARIGLPHAVKSVGDPDGLLTASVVRRRQPRQGRAMLYVHGWSDCFYQAHLAEAVESWGYDFIGLDLRRYGRNLVPGQMAGWVRDLAEYDEEINAAVSLLRVDHDSVTMMGHSTGGLTVPLWVSRHPGRVDGVILNSPWIDLQGSFLTRALAGPLARSVRIAEPTTVLPIPSRDNFGHTIRREFGGEWDVPEVKDPSWAPFVTRAGWLAAILDGHEKVARGLHIDVPMLVLISDRSDLSATWKPSMASADTVLDVERLARASVNLGRHLTLVRIRGGLHDLVLSAPSVRASVFAEMGRWVGAYLA
ncbi:alpha/beta hydrolase [Cutibacterium sp. V947]|uniref:alpha/beta hydrolase n=1 Tax=Cutibacterium sp. V947 TaxID=3446480 RepID=UPI003EE299C8